MNFNRYFFVLSLLFLAILSGCKGEDQSSLSSRATFSSDGLCERIKGSTYFSLGLDEKDPERGHSKLTFTDSYKIEFERAGQTIPSIRYRCLDDQLSIAKGDFSFDESFNNLITDASGTEVEYLLQDNESEINYLACDDLLQLNTEDGTPALAFSGLSSKGSTVGHVKIYLDAGAVSGLYECEAGLIHVHQEGQIEPTVIKKQADGEYLLLGDEPIVLQVPKVEPVADCPQGNVAVCSVKPIQCVMSPCDEGVYTTYSNLCLSSADGAHFRFEGSCNALNGAMFNGIEYAQGERIPLASLEVTDYQLQRCIRGSGYTYVDELTSLVCSGVEDSRGLEALIALKELELLNVGSNINFFGLENLEILEILTNDKYLRKLDLTSLAHVKTVSIISSSLEEVILPDAAQISTLQISAPVKSLDVSTILSLDTLSVGSDELSSLDLSFNSSLKFVNLWGPKIESVLLPASESQLLGLDVNSDALVKLDLGTSPKLIKLVLKGVALQTVYMHDTPDTLKTVFVESESLEKIDLSNTTNLVDIHIRGPIDAANLFKNMLLEKIVISDSKVLAFDLPSSPFLEQLDLESSQLKSIDLSQMDGLKVVTLAGELLTDVVLPESVLLKSLVVDAPFLKGIDLALTPNLGALDLSRTAVSVLEVWTQSNMHTLKIPSTVTHVDVSGTKVREIEFVGHELMTFLARDSMLERLDLVSTSLQHVDLGGSSSIEVLSLDAESLVDLDLSTNVSLASLKLAHSTFSNLDLSKQVLLTDLHVGPNTLESLSLVNQTLLSTLYVGQNNLSALSLEENSLLKKLTLVDPPFNPIAPKQNNITQLTIDGCGSGFPYSLVESDRLTVLGISGCKLETLGPDLSESLSTLILVRNSIGLIDLRLMENLNYVELRDNKDSQLKAPVGDDSIGFIFLYGNGYGCEDLGVEYESKCSGDE